MNALADGDVGKYLNEHFVSTFQKVGAFRIVAGQKQGGNVASYFCTPEGQVLHIVAGPVDAATLLREATWVVETWKMAQLVNPSEGPEPLFRQAHADRLRQEHGAAAAFNPGVSGPDMHSLLRNSGLAPQGKVHLLLIAHPLMKIERIYRSVFENILNEEVSTNPVIEAAALDHYRRVPSLTPEETRQRAQEDRLRRARNNPPRQEILSAESLNVLLVDLQQLENRDIRGPDVPLTAELLEQINVTTGKGPVSVGLLKQRLLSWPLALRACPYDNDRQLLDSLVAKALTQALREKVDRDSVKAMAGAVENLEAGLRLNVKDAPAPQYIEARRFLGCLKEELKILQLPDASLYINGTYAARGKTLQELIRHLSPHGLRFAPATPGNETAYLALHHALVACDLKAHAAATEMIIDPIEPIAAE